MHLLMPTHRSTAIHYTRLMVYDIMISWIHAVDLCYEQGKYDVFQDLGKILVIELLMINNIIFTSNVILQKKL